MIRFLRRHRYIVGAILVISLALWLIGSDGQAAVV